jgi:hypothetical protein
LVNFYEEKKNLWSYLHFLQILNANAQTYSDILQNVKKLIILPVAIILRLNPIEIPKEVQN